MNNLLKIIGHTKGIFDNLLKSCMLILHFYVKLYLILLISNTKKKKTRKTNELINERLQCIEEETSLSCVY